MWGSRERGKMRLSTSISEMGGMKLFTTSDLKEYSTDVAWHFYSSLLHCQRDDGQFFLLSKKKKKN